MEGLRPRWTSRSALHRKFREAPWKRARGRIVKTCRLRQSVWILSTYASACPKPKKLQRLAKTPVQALRILWTVATTVTLHRRLPPRKCPLLLSKIFVACLNFHFKVVVSLNNNFYYFTRWTLLINMFIFITSYQDTYFYLFIYLFIHSFIHWLMFCLMYFSFIFKHGLLVLKNVINIYRLQNAFLKLNLIKFAIFSNAHLKSANRSISFMRNAIPQQHLTVKTPNYTSNTWATVHFPWLTSSV